MTKIDDVFSRQYNEDALRFESALNDADDQMSWVVLAIEDTVAILAAMTEEAAEEYRKITGNDPPTNEERIEELKGLFMCQATTNKSYGDRGRFMMRIEVPRSMVDEDIEDAIHWAQLVAGESLKFYTEDIRDDRNPAPD